MLKWFEFSRPYCNWMTKLMSIRKASSLYETCKIVSRAIDNGQLNLALQLIHDFVERIITEPLCTGHVNGSKELDKLCEKIGAYNFLEIAKDVSKQPPLQNDLSVYVYIVTKVQNSGGHSRVLEQFIKARPDAMHVILSTELNGKSSFIDMLNQLRKITEIIFEPALSGNFQQKLSWLQKRLIEIHPQQIYLFNDHQDSIAIAAIQPSMGLKASFYHHGDHHLCLGVCLSHLAQHIDIHPMGYHHCRTTLGVDNIYLPLTTEDKGLQTSGISFKRNRYLTTCTAARANKIENPYFVSYFDFIPQLLKATGGKHVHIGRLSPWGLFRLRRGLKKYGVRSEQFVYVPWVSSVWETLHALGVDLYIASFPYGGGLTLIEAMGAGIPVAIHQHIYSRVLSGVDLAYPEAFSWQDPDALLAYCSTVTDDELQQLGKIGRQHYEQVYHSDHFNALLNERAEALVPAKLSEYQIKSDEWVCWMENQLTLSKLMMRTAYRAYRKIRRQ